MELSIIIPTYNGKHLLEEYLPSLMEAVEFYGNSVEIIIVENGSSDGSSEFLRNNYPHVVTLKNKSNEGFGPAVNRGVREARHPYVLLLNNDIRVEKDFLQPLTEHFEDPSVFAVVAASYTAYMEGKVNESVTVPTFQRGALLCHQPLVHEPTKAISEPCTNMHASGGFALFDRNKFIELGYFDDDYHPFYYEDVDLSYKAWKRGWKVIYEPRSIVHHRSHSTSRTVSNDAFIHKIEERNRFLLTWKNLSDPQFVWEHIKFVLWLFYSAMHPHRTIDRGRLFCMFSALPKLPKILWKRLREIPQEKFSDIDIFRMSRNHSTPYINFTKLLKKNEFRPEAGLKILLIDPPGYQKGLNVGIAYLAGALKAAGLTNIEVLDLNNSCSGISTEKVVQLIQEKQYDLIGFSIKTPTYNAAIALSREISRSFPEIPQVAGGPHVTLNYREFMEGNSQFAYAVLGEGEVSFAELCRHVMGERDDLPEGVVSRTNLGSQHAPSFIKDIDSIPFPDYSVFTGYDFSNFDYLLVTSRGCPYMCTYCSVGFISGKKMRFRSVESVIQELRTVKEQLGIRHFNIIDDNFTQHVKRAKTLCDRLVEEKLQLGWACGNGIRADMLDQELANKMKEAGCHLVCVGVENADPKVFDTIKKGETLDDIKRGIRLLKNAGIEVVGFFIIGLPGDSPKSSTMSLDFIRDTHLDSARFGLLLPYPKTEVYDILQGKGIFLKDYKDGTHFSDELEAVFETTEFSANEMVDTYKRLYTKLGYLTFLLPETGNKWKRIIHESQLNWKYDKTRLFRRL